MLQVVDEGGVCLIAIGVVDFVGVGLEIVEFPFVGGGEVDEFKAVGADAVVVGDVVGGEFEIFVVD